MAKGHSNVYLEDMEPTTPVGECIKIKIRGGATAQTVKDLPPLALRRSEWETIGRAMGWLPTPGLTQSQTEFAAKFRASVASVRRFARLGRQRKRALEAEMDGAYHRDGGGTKNGNARAWELEAGRLLDKMGEIAMGWGFVLDTSGTMLPDLIHETAAGPVSVRFDYAAPSD